MCPGIKVIYPTRLRYIEWFERDNCPSVQAIGTRITPVIASHAHRAHHAVERDIEIVHDRLERLRFSIGVEKRKECADTHEHHDRKERDCDDHLDEGEPGTF